MKKALLLLAGTLIISLALRAQDTTGKSNPPDTSSTKWAQHGQENHYWHHDTLRLFGLMIISRNSDFNSVTRVIVDSQYRARRFYRNVRTHFFILDLGLDNYIDKTRYYPGNYAAYAASPVYSFAPRTPAQGPVTAQEFNLIPEKSVDVNIWIFLQRVNLIRHVVNLEYGLGAELDNFRYQNNITYEPGYQTKVIRDTVNFRKNKLFAEYLTVPLMLNFNTNPFHPHRSFEFNIGVSGGYLFKARTKQISDQRGKVKDNDVFNLEKYQGALVAQIGYGNINFYGSYSLTPLHQNGVEQYPFSVGIRLFGGF